MLVHAWITDTGSLMTENSTVPDRGFILGTPVKIYHFMASSVEEKNIWFQELQNRIFTQKRLFNEVCLCVCVCVCVSHRFNTVLSLLFLLLLLLILPPSLPPSSSSSSIPSLPPSLPPSSIPSLPPPPPSSLPPSLLFPAALSFKHS